MTTTTSPGVRHATAYGNPADTIGSAGGVTLICLSTHIGEPYGTSDHLGFSIDWSVVRCPLTSWPPSTALARRAIADEVRQLRDHVVALTRLSRQEIARAIGVDRRSLSGYVSGQIKPTEARLRLLRELAEIAEWSADRFGEYAPELLRGTTAAQSPLDLIAEREPHVRQMLEDNARALPPSTAPAITVESRTTRPPLHLHALEIWSQESSLPEPSPTPRAGTVYEQDLSRAPQPPSPRPRPRRRRI